MSESIITKKVIADGFKVLMTKKPFEKITISDITSQCGLNRQTFYYHFQDKYELLNWIFDNDAMMPLTDNLTFDNWSRKLLGLLQTIQDNAKFYSNALKTSYGQEFKQFIMKATTKVFLETIEHITDKKKINNTDKIFIAEFFAYGVNGTIIQWVTSGMKESPEVIVSHLENLVEDCKKLAVERYLKENTEI